MVLTDKNAIKSFPDEPANVDRLKTPPVPDRLITVDPLQSVYAGAELFVREPSCAIMAAWFAAVAARVFPEPLT